MKTIDLLLTLGHNSSAIAVEVGDDKKSHIICGYEEERLTYNKSDSRFPYNAIKRCMEVAGTSEVNELHVTHWATDGHLSSMSRKHWDGGAIQPKVLNTNDRQFTHHDCHAQAAYWYAYSRPGLPKEGTMIFVVDGFGNVGEHISIYQATSYGAKLVRRLFGYGGSMGLMYQYMTAFMGMKMHEDEYKILGYEVHIDEVDVDRRLLDEIINKEITGYLDGYFGKTLLDPYDPMVKLDALPALQTKLINHWMDVMKTLNLGYDSKSMQMHPTFHNRVVMSYLVQSVLEGVITTLVKIYRPKNLICSGGVFYNVKLNRQLLNFIPGKLCVFPLAGDQGNALGLYAIDHDLVWPGHLNWGVRPKIKNKLNLMTADFHVCGILSNFTELAYEALKKRGMVNIVRGAMEFGPRALCNTSTIALPDPAIVSRINRMNGRNTVMPMAPVMSRPTYKIMMRLTDKVHMSEEHMIIALPYYGGLISNVLGAAHKYPTEYTGRPQVIDGDPVMDRLFCVNPVLINTSFNVHGRPIVYTAEDAKYNHDSEIQHDAITTLYLEGDHENSRNCSNRVQS
jgi:predicted NodU family carbamoyl transferase